MKKIINLLFVLMFCLCLVSMVNAESSTKGETTAQPTAPTTSAPQQSVDCSYFTESTIIELNLETIDLDEYGWDCKNNICKSLKYNHICLRYEISDGTYSHLFYETVNSNEQSSIPDLGETSPLIVSSQINGETGGSPSTSSGSQFTPTGACTTQRCREIDQVWQLVNSYVKYNPKSSQPTTPTSTSYSFEEYDFNIIWDAFNNIWTTFNSVWKEETSGGSTDEGDPVIDSTTGGSTVTATDIPGESVSLDLNTAEKLVKVYRQYDSFIDESSSENNVPISLIVSVMLKENGGNPDLDPTIVSTQGAIGLMQVKPETAADVGVTGDLKDPKTNIDAGTKYLKKLLNKHSSDLKLTLADYNGGYVAVQNSEICLSPQQYKYECLWDDMERSTPNTGFKETRNYVAYVLAYKQLFENNKLDTYEVIEEIDNVKCAAANCILKSNAKEALIEAAENADDEDYGLHISSAFRTVEYQKYLWNYYGGRNKGVCPINPAGAEPTVEELRKCPHTKGITVDVTLTEKGNKLSESKIGCAGAGECYTSGKAKYDSDNDYQQLLREEIFSDWHHIESEWWHFEYRN